MESKFLKKFEYKKWLLRFFIVLLTAIPIFRLIDYLEKNGVDNLSNDYVLWISPIDQILNGTYDWKNVFQDAFTNGHSILLPFLLQVANAFFFHSNVYVLIYLGIFLAVIRLVFLYKILTFYSPNPFQYLLWPILSALVFSPSQVSTYEFDLTSIMEGFFQLGLFLGLWAIMKFPGRSKAVWWCLSGGILACVSYGGGLMVWPIFLVAMLLLGFRRPSFYLIWFLGCLITFGFYSYFLVLNPVGGPQTVKSIFNFSLIVQALGWPFSQYFSHSAAIHRGWVALLLFLSGGVILYGNRSRMNKSFFLPGLLLALFGILQAWQIGLVRFNLNLWYATHFMIFWLGLVGIAYALWIHRTNLSRSLKYASGFWCALVLGILLFFYATSNITFLDKSFFIRARAPVSASCLRNYKNAPTYCERTLFQWNEARFEQMAQLGEPLERHQLSVFAPHQKWFLQGDFILDNVKRHEGPLGPISWLDNHSHPVSFSDFRRLNLLLHSPNSVDWTVKIPENIKKAVFHSAVRLSPSAPIDKRSDGVVFEVYLSLAGSDSERIFSHLANPDQRDWHVVEIDLGKYAGETITLSLGSQAGKNSIYDWAVYRSPFIEIILNGSSEKTGKEETAILPSNTDLSVSLPQPTVDDWVFKDQKPLNLYLRDYVSFYFKMALPSNVRPRLAQIFLQFNGQPGYQKVIQVPLLPDENLHTYIYNTKLLELDPTTRLMGLKFEPVVGGGPPEKDGIQVSDFRLIRSPAP